MNSNPDALPELKTKLTKRIIQVLRDAGYSEEQFHIGAIMSDTQLRDGVVRTVYKQLRENGLRNREAMREIEDSFHIGDSYLKKILFR